jgi:hypothetical protein
MDRRRWLVLAACASLVVAALACGSQSGAPAGGGAPDAGGKGDDGSTAGGDASHGKDSGAGSDAAVEAASGSDGAGTVDVHTATDAAGAETGADAAGGTDAGGTDAGSTDVGSTDAASDAVSDGPSGEATDGPSAEANDGAADASGNDGGQGILTGGPCISGAAGATAYRVRWIDAGGTAQVQYEVDGLPDTSRDQTGAYGYQIGFTPSYVDPFLGAGGLQLDDSDFVDVEISTVGLSSITSVTLSIFGRSYSVDTNGSFNWQTFDGTGQTATDFVSNVPPYQWYSADITGDILPGENNVTLRIKAGPSSDALVVNRIELCMVAQ